jgi:3-deoxy-D-manno-octulosonic-acid transferase
VYWLYNPALRLTSFALGILSGFNDKIGKFVQGRKHTFAELRRHFPTKEGVVWIHTASLGEYEQGLPLILQLRKTYPEKKILLTFFSPSGYEVKKNAANSDWVAYLPLDTRSNVDDFLDLISPQIAIFVKYEIWPNYYRSLGQRGIPLILVSAFFKKEQVFFRWYGGFMRQVLSHVTHFFVQDRNSVALLQNIGIHNVSQSGDTRFDRVSEILARDNSLPFMDAFTRGKTTLVAGSTWPQDEAILVPHINAAPRSVKYVIAPHDINASHITGLQKSITKKVQRYSELDEAALAETEVLIIDTIGLLTRIYSYADIAYVGGGFATGLHNTLEPAVFGIPVIIGPDYHRFREAAALVAKKGLLVVHQPSDFEALVSRLLNEPGFRQRTGLVNSHYISQNKGATEVIMDYLQQLL